MAPKGKFTIIPNSDSEDDEGGHGAGVDRLTEHHVHQGDDGRLHHQFNVLEVPASPTKPTKQGQRLRPDLPPVFEGDMEEFQGWDEWPEETADDGPVYDLVGKDVDLSERGRVKKEPRDARPSDNPLGEWVRKEKPQEYLDEVILQEGRGDYAEYDECIRCGVAGGIYRCRECFTDDLYCKQCMVDTHASSPLHRVEMWENGFFAKTTLKALGLRIQLGHGLLGPGRRGRCFLPQPAVDDDFVIVDNLAIHEVGLDFCDCATAQPHDIQLLRARLYPATVKFPRTASTFRVLRTFHIFTLESKCSAQEFYHSIVRQTDNTGTVPVRDRYDEFLRMTREWRHIQMLKRAGRGHDATGVRGTTDGACALLCPACPHPGKNLPADWKQAPKEKRHLYALFLALDANFRMRRKKVSSEQKDPSLGDGWSFFGRIAPYYSYLAKHWGQKQERSTCVAHDAVDKPDRESRGTASSGIATVDCARHNMKRPNAVGDLQLGERYINMDYIFFMGLAGSEVAELYVSYDIACQWHKNIWDRMKTFPKEIRFKKGKQYCVFLIPKFHLPAHIEACNVLFSFHLTKYVGMTDGEAPERGWSNLNPLATSTAEMGPGLRRDTINDAFNDWNHKKIIGLGAWGVKRIMECVPEMITLSVEFEELEESLRRLGAAKTLEEWRKEVEAWEDDAKKPNPFTSRVKHKTVLDVRREMAKEVEVEMDEDELEGLTITDDMHATEMIGMGMQLEELQRSLGTDMARVGQHPSKEQQANMTERTNKLRRKVVTWMDAQVTFIPHVALLRAEEDRARTRIAATQPQPGIQVHHMALWMPSSIKGRVPCDTELYKYEFRLREAQAGEALDDLRDQLLLRTHLYKHKDRFVRGVKANTRCQGKIDAVEERLRRTADRYRAARRALEGLGKELHKTDWEIALRPLAEQDVRGMPRALFQDPERKKTMMKKGPQARATAARAGREAKQAMSWIWRTPGIEEKENGEKGMNEALRLDWAKTRARFMRQREQTDLVEEEMRRILQFLRWRAYWWDGMCGKRPQCADKTDRDPDTAYAPKHKAYQEGSAAYAKRQAAQLRKLAERFEEDWKDVADFISMGRMALGILPEEDEDEDEEWEARSESELPPDELPVPRRTPGPASSEADSK